MNTLRILVVLPFYGGSLPIGRYAVQALRDEGHVVAVFEAPEFFSAFSALKGLQINTERLQQLENGFLNTVSQAIYAKAEYFEPDLVLSLAQAPLNRATLRRFEKDKVVTAMWFVEDHAVFPYWRAFAPCYDLFFVIQKDPFLELLHTEGAHGVYLPMAALPAFHAPSSLTAGEQRTFGSDISFLGAGYPNRRVAFRELTSFDFKIWGTEWEGEVLLKHCVQQAGARIAPEDAVKIFNATKININLHSSIRANTLIGHGDFVNPRTFELAACAAFQLVDPRSLLPELFAEDELATFSSMEALREAIGHYLAHPEERELFAGKARKRVLAEHTYQHRMRALIETVRQKYPDWPVERTGTSLPADLPEPLRDELGVLFSRLHVPAQVEFCDLIARIRQESGALNRLETALLFLDEWRKQYTRK